MARKGKLTLSSELYPVEFVRYFDQLHSISEKLAMPDQEQVPNDDDEPKARRRLNFGLSIGPVCASCGMGSYESSRRYFNENLYRRKDIRRKTHCFACFNAGL